MDYMLFTSAVSPKDFFDKMCHKKLIPFKNQAIYRKFKKNDSWGLRVLTPQG